MTFCNRESKIWIKIVKIFDDTPSLGIMVYGYRICLVVIISSKE